jgi:hypothetical protein
MSGFFGVFSPSGNIDQLAFDQMKSAIHRDGYDELEICVNNQIAIGHLMLRVAPESIYDRQPLRSECGRYMLVGHFRLDYRDDLGDKLGLTQKELEHISDSMLVMKSFLKWSEKCVNHLEGDWAFVLYDTISTTLFLARDKIGYSSLFYSQTNERLFFASDLDALISGLPNIEIDKVQLYLMSLGRNYVTQGRTLYKHVFFLHPSSSLSFNMNLDCRAQQLNYFKNLPQLKFQFESDYFLEFRSCFQMALKNKIRVNEKIGISLSGGLDSVLIAKSIDFQFRKSGQSLYSFTRLPIELDEYQSSIKKDKDEFEVIKKINYGFTNTIFHASSYSNFLISDFLKQSYPINSFNPILTANTYWLEGIAKDVKERSIKQLVTGQFGNYTLSWDAPVINFPISFISLVKNLLKLFLNKFFSDKSIFDNKKFLNLWQRFFVLKELVRRQKIFLSSRDLRRYLIKQNGYDLGARHYNRGFNNAILIADPTIDERFLNTSLSISENLFNKKGDIKYIYRKSFNCLFGLDFFSISTSNNNQAVNIKFKFSNDRALLKQVLEIKKNFSSNSTILNEKLNVVNELSGEQGLKLSELSDLNTIYLLRYLSTLRFSMKMSNFMQ